MREEIDNRQANQARRPCAALAFIVDRKHAHSGDVSLYLRGSARPSEPVRGASAALGPGASGSLSLEGADVRLIAAAFAREIVGRPRQGGVEQR
jgi:hypothetical protein